MPACPSSAARKAAGGRSVVKDKKSQGKNKRKQKTSRRKDVVNRGKQGSISPSWMTTWTMPVEREKKEEKIETRTRVSTLLVLLTM